jgi:3-hydroxyisobutyrate dehydrogenase
VITNAAAAQAALRRRRHHHGVVRETSNPRIGFIGLGRMGMPTCARLVRRGFSVCATDLRLGCRDELEAAGGRWQSTASAVAANADVVISMLPGARDVAAVAVEIARAAAGGSVWVDMSTGSPQAAEEVAVIAVSSGLRVLDAPVAGGPDDARSGRLLTFVGATEPDFCTVSPVLASIADRIVHVGSYGSGYLVKLMANALWFSQSVAVAEMLTLARRARLDLDVVRDAIGQSAAASRFMAEDADALLAGDDRATFSLARCCEQLATILDYGARRDITLASVGLANDVHRRAVAHYGDVDGELLGARLIAAEAGVDLRRT